MLHESLETKLTNRLIKDISSVLLSGKSIKKLYLYYDSKVGKKKWRYEFDNSIINQQSPKQSPQERHSFFQKSGSLPEAASNIVISLFEKLKFTFNGKNPEVLII